MKVLLINQFFYPDKSATSQLLTDLAEDLVQKGMHVTVLCSQSGYLGETNPGTERYRDIEIARLTSLKFSKSTWGRLSSYLSFYFAVLLALLRMPRFDVIVVLTTPPLIALIPALLKGFLHAKTVYVVQDLYPDIAVALGLMKSNGILAKSLDLVSRFSLRRSDVVIAIGECMKVRLLSKRLSPQQIRIVQNWANSDEIVPIQKSENPFVQTHKLNGKFVVLYSGNMGRAHDINTLVEAAKLLQNDERVQFVFIGDGAKRACIERAQQERGLENILLLPYVERAELSYSLGAADACLVSQMPETCGLMVPSKIYGIMAAGKPLLYVGPEESEAAKTIKEHSCGFVIENGAAHRLVSAIRLLIDQRDRLMRMGAQARLSLVNHFDRRLLTTRYFNIINQWGADVLGTAPKPWAG